MTIRDITGRIRDGLNRAAAFFGGSEEEGKERRNTILILQVVIIILVNIVSLTLSFRCDLTRNRTYSLSKRSREVVSNLKENLKIKVLFSRDLPAQHSSLFRYLRDLLEEYNYYGNEYFSYEIVDEKDLEKQAADYGVRPVQSQELDNDQLKVRRAYMALVIQQSDVVEKIEAVTDPTGLEYRITSLMEKMSGKIDGLLKLTKPIQVTLYMDGALVKLPIEEIDGVKEKVQKAVEACNRINYDKLQFHAADPSADANAAIAAELYGVSKLRWNGGRDRFGNPIAPGEGFFGIVLKGPSRAETLELSVAPTLLGKNVVVGLDGLEDRINNAVTGLVSANPRVGYITGHGEVDLNDQQSQDGGGLLKQILDDVYDVTFIDLKKEEIPADLGLIIVNGPRSEFSERELFKIDQFLMRGKAAVFFIDSFNEINMGRQNIFGNQPIVLPVKTGLEPLLSSYGLTQRKNIVLDTSCARGMVGGTPRDFYYVPIIKKGGFNTESPITRYLRGLALIKASSIDIDENLVKDLKLKRTVLVSSSDESWQMTGEINLNPFFLAPPETKEEMQKFSLAVMLEGRFNSYFKNKPEPPEQAKEGEKIPAKIAVREKLDRTVSTGSSRIILVGTSEITRSGFLMNSRRIISSALSEGEEDRVFSNGFFIHSMVDVLLGNDYIPEMSSKSLDFNPIDKTSDGLRFALKAVNIGGVPILVVIAGLVIWRRRAARKRLLQQRFSGERNGEEGGGR